MDNQTPVNQDDDGSLTIQHGDAQVVQPQVTPPATSDIPVDEDDDDYIPPADSFFSSMEVPTTPPEKVEAWKQVLAAHPISPYFMGYYGQRYAGVEFTAEDLAALEDMLEQIKAGFASETPEVPDLANTPLPPLSPSPGTPPPTQAP